MLRLWLSVLFLAAACLPKPERNGENTGVSPTPEIEAFELIGSWEYTGGLGPLTNTMEFSEDEMLDFGDYNGTDWSITWDIDSWDNDTDRSLLVLDQVQGFSHYDVGDHLYMTWQADGSSGNFYFSTDDYVETGGGTEGTEFLTFTRQ